MDLILRFEKETPVHGKDKGSSKDISTDRITQNHPVFNNGSMTIRSAFLWVSENCDRPISGKELGKAIGETPSKASSILYRLKARYSFIDYIYLRDKRVYLVSVCTPIETKSLCPLGLCIPCKECLMGVDCYASKGVSNEG